MLSNTRSTRSKEAYLNVKQLKSTCFNFNFKNVLQYAKNRCKIHYSTVCASCSKPRVALIKSRSISFAVSVSPFRNNVVASSRRILNRPFSTLRRHAQTLIQVGFQLLQRSCVVCDTFLGERGVPPASWAS